MYIVVVEDSKGALVSEHALTDGIMLFGRTPDNDVVLADSSISRRHARLYLEGTVALISDEGSANGVLVDDHRISEPTILATGSQARLGDYRIFIERIASGSMRDDSGLNTAILHPGQAHGKLVITEGKHAGMEILLFDPIACIGRTDENDITLPDVSVSRHHARLKRQDDGSYVVSDLASSNGTLARGRRVKGPTRIHHGAQLQFGSVKCTLVDRDGKTSTAPTKQWLLYGAAVLAAAAIGVLASLILSR